MYLKEISLTDFRNYERLLVRPHRELNFVTGPNARGKTNFLEAVFFSGLGRSFRGNDRDVIRWGADRALLRAVFEIANSTFNVDADISSDGKKKLLIDGADNGRRDLPGRFGIILFKPDDLQIIKGSPAQRRDYIDSDLGIMEPLYRDALLKYRRVLAHRNNVLRNGGEPLGDTLKVWNEQLYNYGGRVLYFRLKLLKKFFPLVKQAYGDISGADEELEIRYLSTITLSGTATMDQITGEFAAEGKARQKEELYKKQTVIGPHRDDVVFYLNGKDVKQFGSQGQIRSLVLALKTAQMKMFRNETGEHPVLLLDDVFTELDEFRQRYLIEMIDGQMQTFITSAAGREKINRYRGKIYLVDGFGMKEV